MRFQGLEQPVIFFAFDRSLCDQQQSSSSFASRMRAMKFPWSAERSIGFSRTLMRQNTGKFGSSTNRATTTSTLRDFLRPLSFPKPFAGRYWLPFNSAARAASAAPNLLP